jgi:hypothetical protein
LGYFNCPIRSPWVVDGLVLPERKIGDATMTMTIGHIVRAAFFLAGAWAALAALLVALPWMPLETALQSAKLVLLPALALVLAICAFGAGAALLGLSGMTAKREASSRPYQSAVTPPA